MIDKLNYRILEYGNQEGLIVENKGSDDLIFTGDGYLGLVESNTRKKIFYNVTFQENRITNDPLQIIN